MCNIKICLMFLIIAIIGFQNVENKKLLAVIKAPLIGAKVAAIKEVGTSISDAAFKNFDAIRATGTAVSSVALLPYTTVKKVAAAKVAKVKAVKKLKLKKLKKLIKPSSFSLTSILSSPLSSSTSLLSASSSIVNPSTSDSFGLDGNAHIRL